VNEAANVANNAATYANQTAYRAQIAAQDAVQATADAMEAAAKAESSMLVDAYIDENGVLTLDRLGRQDISVGKVTGEKGDKGDPGIVDYSLVAGAIKGKKCGAAVALTDVSPLEHEMAVQLKGEGVDLSAVTLKKYGKNFIPYPYTGLPLEVSGVNFTDNGNGTITVNGTAAGTPTVNFSTATLPKGTYFVSSGIENSYGVSVRVYDSKGVNIGHSLATSIQSFTIAEPTKVTFRLYGADGKTYNNLVVYPQLEVGTTATEYELYKEPITYTADENGIVKGVTSLCPTTTLITDTAGVTIEAEYNKDTNKVIANLMEKIAALENAAAEQI